MYYNSYALTREMTDRRIAKLKAELTMLEDYIGANKNKENKPALDKIHANVTGQLNALQGDNIRRVLIDKYSILFELVKT